MLFFFSFGITTFLNQGTKISISTNPSYRNLACVQLQYESVPGQCSMFSANPEWLKQMPSLDLILDYI